MRLSVYLRDRYARDRDLRGSSLQKLEYSVRRFSEFLGRPAELSDLTTDAISRFTIARQETRSARTARNDRDSIYLLAKAAADEGLAPEIRRPRRPKVARKPPEAWDVDQLKRLRAATERMPNALYWRTLLDTAFETCLRCSDVLRFDMETLSENGTATLVVEKTGQVHSVRLTPATIEALRKLGGRYPLRWKSHSAAFYYAWIRLRRLAGVQRGAMQQIRRTAASMLEAQQPGSATRALGHKTPWLASDSYIDPRIAGRQPLQPPTDWRDDDEKKKGDAA